MQCPGCSDAMIEERLDGRYGQRVASDLCFGCAVAWFDDYESSNLAPGAILRLFALIHERRAERRPSVLAHPACPRCHAPLQLTSDRQRHVWFQYWRCPAEHGRLTAFVEFLREKDFVRPLAPAELADLRARVKVVHCDCCGAPVDLEKTSACAYCRAPISVLDSAQVERVVHELRAADERRQTADPLLPARLMMDRLAVESFFRKIEGESSADTSSLGLVGTGIAALVGMMTAAE
ncbi:MAG: zf-TFIIB domain-containing protein [Candidatus Rokubacteria bacterium]|nr:zf-TFIIB domain-containing protein [Candidatus Rokubacteria bacterium]